MNNQRYDGLIKQREEIDRQLRELREAEKKTPQLEVMTVQC